MTIYYQDRGYNRGKCFNPGDIFVVGNDKYQAIRAVAVGGIPHRCADCPLREKDCFTGKYNNKPWCSDGDRYVYLKKIKMPSLTTVVGSDALRVGFTTCGTRLYARTLKISGVFRGGGELGRMGRYAVYSISRCDQIEYVVYLPGINDHGSERTTHYDYCSPDEATLARKAFQTIIRSLVGDTEKKCVKLY